MNFADLHNFVSTMTANVGAPAASYLANISPVFDVDQWLRTMAVSTILTNGETNLLNGRDDDYSVYAGVVNPKFNIIFHDMDTILGLGDADAITLVDLQGTPSPAAATIYDVVDPGMKGDTFSKLAPFFAQPTVLTKYHQELLNLLNGAVFQNHSSMRWWTVVSPTAAGQQVMRQRSRQRLNSSWMAMERPIHWGVGRTFSTRSRRH